MDLSPTTEPSTAGPTRTGDRRRAVLAAAVLLIAMASGACGSDDPTLPAEGGTGTGEITTSTTVATDTSAAPPTTEAVRTIEVKLEGGSVTGGARRETVAVGEKVRLVGVADSAEELHLHTYDLRVDLTPGTPGEIVFVADIPGRHEVEFEKAHKQALTLEVK